MSKEDGYRVEECALACHCFLLVVSGLEGDQRQETTHSTEPAGVTIRFTIVALFKKSCAICQPFFDSCSSRPFGDVSPILGRSVPFRPHVVTAQEPSCSNGSHPLSVVHMMSVVPTTFKPSSCGKHFFGDLHHSVRRSLLWVGSDRGHNATIGERRTRSMVMVLTAARLAAIVSHFSRGH